MNKQRLFKTVFLFFLYIALDSAGFADVANDGCFPLVQDGKPAACLVVAKGAEGPAKELVRYIQMISGATLPTVKAEQKDTLPVLHIGTLTALSDLRLDVAAEQLGPEGYVIMPVADGMALAGTEASLWFGVYDMLHQLGCRFFLPGPEGEFVPRQTTLALKKSKQLECPAFMGRSFAFATGGKFAMTGCSQSNYADWARKNRLGGMGFDHYHALAKYLPAEKYYQTHPEYYALVRGKRLPTQPCFSNDAAAEIIADAIAVKFKAGARSASLSSNDGGDFCACPKCLAERGEGYDATVNQLSMANKIARRLQKEYPDRYLCFYASYGVTGVLPEGIHIEPNLIPVLFPYGLGFHPENKTKVEKIKTLFAQWKKAGAKQTGIYDYLQMDEFEVPNFKELATIIPLAKQNNAIFLHYEIDGTSWMNNLMMYVVTRLAWDPYENVDGIVEDYLTKFYGNAAPAMRGFYQKMILGVIDADPQHVGIESALKGLSPTLVGECEADLARAATLADDDRIRKRVEIAQRSFQLDLLVLEKERARQSLLQEKNKDNRRKLLEAQKQVKDYREKYEEQNLRHDFYEVYTKKPVPPGKEYKIICQLPDIWEFRFDEKMEGEKGKWFEQWNDSEDWAPISILNFWEMQGYPKQDGHAWYQARFKIPYEVNDFKNLYLYFGAVDDHAWVYLNGKSIGAHAIGAIGWDHPFALPIEGLLREKEDNLLVVHVWDMEGMGGIFRPVWLVRKSTTSQ